LEAFLAHVLGFDAQLVAQHYEKEEQLAEKQSTAQTIKNELGGSIEDISKIEGILLLKQKEAEKKQKLLDAFDFRAQDKDSTKQLVDDIDERIASLNAERYSLNQNKRRSSPRWKRIRSFSTLTRRSACSRKLAFCSRGRSRRIFNS
jgi:uncharacterized protein YydD (DUF2326 family)